ncbi:MAG: restriction endonuclease subunit S [Clostridia bacterium]|jgi:type I restriction enzyme S subunit|nr:restriction endonuclease subunit S [Clostridia bacterium]
MGEWKKVKLRDVVQFNPKESIPRGEISKKISMDKLEPHTKYIHSYDKAKYSGGTKFRNGDTLFARITPCLENGKTSQVTLLNENEVGFGSTEFIVLREIENISDKNFIYYLSISPEFRNVAIKSMVGSSGRQRVQQRVLEDMEFDFPSLPEQRAIASILSVLDDKIELNNKINKNLEEIAQTIFKNWFVDFEPFKDGEFVESELGLIPKGWRVGTLTDIAEYLNGLAMQKFRPENSEKGIHVLKIRELRQRHCDSSSDLCSQNIKDEYIVKDGDVIFSWSGSLLVDFWCGGICGLNQHLFKITSKKYDKWFYYMWTDYHLQKFISIAKDKTTTMGHIKRKELSNSFVLIPDKQVYKKITSLLNPLFDLVIKNRIENRKLSHFRDMLLPKLMNGEIRVPVEE